MEIGTGKKKMGLSTQIFIALLAGAICGVCVHYFLKEGYFRDTILVGGVFYVLGQGFIRLMQMLVVPLVLCSLVCGSMSIGDTKTLGKVGGKAILFYLCTTALAIIVALGIALMIDPGTGVAMENVSKADIGNTEQVSMADTLLNIIPKNPIGAMANGDMLPIIVFALFIGVLLAKMGNRASTLSNFFAQFNDLMMEMTMAVMKVAPIGVFCLIAKTFAEIGFDAYGSRYPGTGSAVSGGVSAAAVCFHSAQSAAFFEKVFSCNDVCVYDGNIQCDHPAFHRYTG